jgi:hypothetical protein
MGGIRGLVEAVLPGLIFIILFSVTHELVWALAASLGVALLTVIARLVQRSSLQQALGGIFGIVIGAIWAWRSGEATDFFAFALWQNAAYLVAVLISQLIAWPAVGVVIELLRFSGAMRDKNADDSSSEPAAVIEGAGAPLPDAAEEEGNPFAGFGAWRQDKNLLRRYRLATWFWIGLFAVRLAVQVPLFLGQSVGWLGVARLVMGVPLWGLVLYLTWAVIHGAHRGAVAHRGAAATEASSAGLVPGSHTVSE